MGRGFVRGVALCAALLLGLVSTISHTAATAAQAQGTPAAQTATSTGNREQRTVHTSANRVLLPILTRPEATTPSSSRTGLTLAYTIDRSQLPPLYYQALTLRIYVGQVTAVQVTAGTPDGSPQPVDYVHDPERQTVTVTTAATRVRIHLEDPGDRANAGRYQKTALKGGARWAWSHSLDDNIRLYPSIDALRAHGYRGTLYLIAKHVDDSREQEWIVDAPAVHRLLADGWSIGNHTWDHPCDPEKIDRQTIVDGYNRLAEVVAASPVPAYRITGFAAPCFKGEYDSLIRQMVAEGTTAVQFNESGGRDLLVVDPGATEYLAAGERAHAFAYEQPVGRDLALALDGGLAKALATVDWMSAHAASDRHFWYNTFTHSDGTEALAALAGYVYDNYGAGGSGEGWVAPADEIYSYLLVRDLTTVSVSYGE